MYNIIDLNFKNIFSFFIFQLIFIKIKSVDLYSLDDDTSNTRDKTLDDCIVKGYTFYNKYDWKLKRKDKIFFNQKNNINDNTSHKSA